MLRHVALATIALSAASAATPPVQAREIVGMRDGRFDPGTIVIRTGERKLYFVTAPGEAIDIGGLSLWIPVQRADPVVQVV